MENIEEAQQAATEAFEDAKEAATEAFGEATEAATEAFEEAKAGFIAIVQDAIKKFGDFIKEKIEQLLAGCKGKTQDQEDRIGYLAGLQLKYEEATKAIDEALHGSDDADVFWHRAQGTLNDVLREGDINTL